MPRDTLDLKHTVETLSILNKDGADAVRFVRSMKKILEDLETLVLET